MRAPVRTVIAAAALAALTVGCSGTDTTEDTATGPTGTAAAGPGADDVSDLDVCNEMSSWHQTIDRLRSWTPEMFSVAGPDTYPAVSDRAVAATDELGTQVSDRDLQHALAATGEAVRALEAVAAPGTATSTLLGGQRAVLEGQVKVAERCYTLSLEDTEADTGS